MSQNNPSSTIFLDPAQINVKVGGTFELVVGMNAKQEAVASTDIIVQYDETKISPILRTKPGDIFPIVQAKILYPGRLYIYGLQQDPSSSTLGQGVVGTVTFQTIKSGQTELRVECDGNKNSTHIVRSRDLADIVDCASTKNHTSTVTIENSSVLGTSSQYSNLNMIVVALTILALCLAVYIWRTLFRRKYKIKK